ncbi:Auxin-induced protein [Macleaya cordata]|uniref:Auxin-induced protein n=1 Tax=Macleaya cordata TaxID=56857 RepID=A0A200QZX5_MACCD|nr:Auxin-induced protein [Macleaya cordata]
MMKKWSLGSKRSGTTNKGHFVVYTKDERRFVVPLPHLENPLFKELLKMAKDEFGLACNGPIRLTCNAQYMEYVLSLLSRQDSQKAIEKTSLCFPK